MSDRRPLIAGNWKMNTSLPESERLASSLASSDLPGIDLVVCPPFPWLVPVRDALAGTSIRLGAQDCWPQPNGAYTGAVSIEMVAELCEFVIAGHSERRQVFGESDELVRQKVDAILAAGMTAILCVGESLPVRQADGAEEFVTIQVRFALAGRDRDELDRIVIAYEPIWAIGTGVAASPDDAAAMAKVIRSCVDALDPGAGSTQRVIYGGSVNASNSGAVLSQSGIDGALVGGASLDAESFLTIARAVSR